MQDFSEDKNKNVENKGDELNEPLPDLSLTHVEAGVLQCLVKGARTKEDIVSMMHLPKIKPVLNYIQGTLDNLEKRGMVNKTEKNKNEEVLKDGNNQ